MQGWSEIARQKGIRYFLIAFVDLFGTMRAKIVPAMAIDQVAKAGAGFAGFATWFDMTPADPDVLVMPEADSLVQLPWKPEVAWVTGDLVMAGKLVQQNPRQVLKRVTAAATEEGYELKSGVECEYFLIMPDGSAISDAADRQAKPCYDQQALMRRYDIIGEICDAMVTLGWNPYQNDHEDANGQFEMNWQYDDRAGHRRPARVLQVHGEVDRGETRPARDLHAQAVCQSHRIGCHVHASLWSRNNGNLFDDPKGELGLSRARLSFPRRASCIRPMRCARSPIRR